MATMPLPSPTGQPESALAWFRSDAGRAVLDSERALASAALAERPGQPWLWCAAGPEPASASGRGLVLEAGSRGWDGRVSCSLPLPLPSDAFATVVLQHVAAGGPHAATLLGECARILVPGGRAWLFSMNPLSPYRWRWRGVGLAAPEPLTWRRRLRAAGLHPDPVSRGLGPVWRVAVDGETQDGPGLRAAFVIRAEKRVVPLTPVRGRARLRLEGAPAA